MQGRPVAIALALAWLAGLVLVGCSSSAETGTVEGRFLAVGGPPPGQTIPMEGTITVTSSDAHRKVPHVKKNTRYKTTVAAGKVALVGRAQFFGGGHYECQPDRPVVVKAGATVHADVLCQMM